MHEVTYLPLGVKNAQRKIIWISLTDIKDFGKVTAAAKMLGCLESDIRTVQEQCDE